VGFPTAIRKQVHAKYDGRCAYCGVHISQKAMQVDHIQARNRNGGDEIENLNPACFACNNYKLTYTVEELRQQIAMQPTRAKQKSVNYRLALRYGLIEETDAPVVFYFERVDGRQEQNDDT